MNKKITILVVRPEQAPVTEEIENTLPAIQAVVGGNVEQLRMGEHGISLMCNEYGNVELMPVNRQVGSHLIRGTFFICRSKGENMVTLTREDVAKYAAMFRLR